MTFLLCNDTRTLVTSERGLETGDWQLEYQTQPGSQSVWSMLLSISGNQAAQWLDTFMACKRLEGSEGGNLYVKWYWHCKLLPIKRIILCYFKVDRFLRAIQLMQQSHPWHKSRRQVFKSRHLIMICQNIFCCVKEVGRFYKILLWNIEWFRKPRRFLKSR